MRILILSLLFFSFDSFAIDLENFYFKVYGSCEAGNISFEVPSSGIHHVIDHEPNGSPIIGETAIQVFRDGTFYGIYWELSAGGGNYYGITYEKYFEGLWVVENDQLIFPGFGYAVETENGPEFNLYSPIHNSSGANSAYRLNGVITNFGPRGKLPREYCASF